MMKTFQKQQTQEKQLIKQNMKQNFEQLALLNFRTREEGKRFICQSLKLEKIIEKHQQKLNQIKQGRLKQNKMQ